MCTLFCTSSHDALHLCEISWKYLKRFSTYSAVKMAWFNVASQFTPKVNTPELRFMCSARRLIVFYICVKFCENIWNRYEWWSAEGRTDTQNFGGYNIISRHFFVAAINHSIVILSGALLRDAARANSLRFPTVPVFVGIHWREIKTLHYKMRFANYT